MIIITRRARKAGENAPDRMDVEYNRMDIKYNSYLSADAFSTADKSTG